MDGRAILERKVLKAMMCSMDVRNKCSHLEDGHFLSQSRRFIYRLCISIQPLLTPALIEYEFTKRGDLKKDEIERIRLEWEAVRKTNVKSDEVDYILEELTRHGRANQIVAAMQAYIGEVKGGNLKRAEENLIKKLFQSRIDNSILNVDEGEVSEDFKERLKLLAERKKLSIRDRCAFGIKSLDKITGGIWPGEMAIVFGVSDVGKSIFSLNVAHYNRIMGKKVLYIDLESSKRFRTQQRYDSLVSGLLYKDKFKLGNINRTEVEQWKKSLSDTDINNGKLYVMAVGGDCSIADLEHYIFAHQLSRKPVDLIIIDFIDMITLGNNRSYSEQYELGRVALFCKRLAGKYNVPVLAVSHRSLNAENKDEEPSQDNMGYSKRKVHYADLILGLYRTTQDLEDNLMTIKLVKSRDGGTNMRLKLVPDLDHMRFKEVDE